MHTPDVNGGRTYDVGYYEIHSVVPRNFLVAGHNNQMKTKAFALGEGSRMEGG